MTNGVLSPETYPEESVLCVPTKDLYAKVGYWRGLREPSPEMWRVLAKKSVFRPRAAVENDPTLKQIISYTLFISDNRIFVMKRLNSQAESRLRGLYSVGVGGHMNKVKDIEWPGKRRISDLKALVGFNTVREIREEVSVAGNPPVGVLGFLNDDETPVGKHHLGVVSLVRLSSPILAVKENDKMLGAWVEFSHLADVKPMESWSALVLQGMV